MLASFTLALPSLPVLLAGSRRMSCAEGQPAVTRCHISVPLLSAAAAQTGPDTRTSGYSKLKRGSQDPPRTSGRGLVLCHQALQVPTRLLGTCVVPVAGAAFQCTLLQLPHTTSELQRSLLQIQLDCDPGNVMISTVNWEEKEEKLSLSLRFKQQTGQE